MSNAKREALDQLLGRGPILVYVDPRRDGVSVPASLRANPYLALRFGYRLKPEIWDLVLDDLAISGTLLFGNQAFHCVLPWSAVWGARMDGDSRMTVWPLDIPEEIRPQLLTAATPADPPPVRRHLKSV